MSAKEKKNSDSNSSVSRTSSQTAEASAAELAVNPAVKAEDQEQDSLGRSVREIFESIAIALVLAFLFRTFLAEMFIIPTGSMAPTLFGQHKDVLCPECGAPFQAGVVQGERTDYALCPNCNALMDFQAEERKGKSNPNFRGDRILVGKYPYYFSSPKRWDVVVFLFPGGGNTNYIKRCVGLPGETIRIQGGDIFVKPNVPLLEQEMAAKVQTTALESPAEQEESLFKIARKPPEKILATMIPVYENDYQSARLRRVNAPARWRQCNTPNIQAESIAYTQWQEQEDGKEFYFKAAPGEMTGWLVYQNLVLSQEDWRQVEMGQTPQTKPRLITDMTSYNTSMPSAVSSYAEDDYSRMPVSVPASSYGRHWVKDLILECTVDVRSLKTGTFKAGLARGDKIFWCTVNLATGDVTLDIPSKPDFCGDAESQEKYEKENQNKENAYMAKAKSNMNATDIYQFRFANVDDQLHVWIDGKPLKFDMPTAYLEQEPAVPTENDLNTPVQIGCQECEVKLSHLSLYRDIYYVARGRDSFNSNTMSDFVRDNGYGGLQVYSPGYDFYSEPAQWPTAFKNLRSVDFTMDSDGEKHYFMLGDNSTNSADCRCWNYPSYDPRGNHYVIEDYVPESLLVGEAYYVYWPHTWKPFVPNFAKFRKIK